MILIVNNLKKMKDLQGYSPNLPHFQNLPQDPGSQHPFFVVFLDSECRRLMSCPFSDREVEDHCEKQKSLLEHYHEHVHNKFNKYAFCFFFCELLNILISVSQVIISYNCSMPSYFTLPDIRDSCFPELSVPGLWVPCLPILQVTRHLRGGFPILVNQTMFSQAASGGENH